MLILDCVAGRYPAVCCSVLQYVALCCSMLLCAAVHCSVLHCTAVCCSVLQCHSVLQFAEELTHLEMTYRQAHTIAHSTDCLLFVSRPGERGGCTLIRPGGGEVGGGGGRSTLNFPQRGVCGGFVPRYPPLGQIWGFGTPSLATKRGLQEGAIPLQRGYVGVPYFGDWRRWEVGVLSWHTIGVCQVHTCSHIHTTS